MTKGHSRKKGKKHVRATTKPSGEGSQPSAEQQATQRSASSASSSAAGADSYASPARERPEKRPAKGSPDIGSLGSSSGSPMSASGLMAPPPRETPLAAAVKALRRASKKQRQIDVLQESVERSLLGRPPSGDELAKRSSRPIRSSGWTTW